MKQVVLDVASQSQYTLADKQQPSRLSSNAVSRSSVAKRPTSSWRAAKTSTAAAKPSVTFEQTERDVQHSNVYRPERTQFVSCLSLLDNAQLLCDV